MMESIDGWFKANATRHPFPFLANVTLDWSCEKDEVVLNDQEVLSVLLNGTFIDEK